MILVTGGTGLVGAHLLYHLSLENETIKAIHRSTSNLEAVKNVFSYYTEAYEQLFQKIEWIEADITDVFALELAFKNVTKVYHCAALISFHEKDYRAMRKINIDGTANIVNFCIEKNVSKLCFVSSIAAVGKALPDTLINEDAEWDIEKSNYGYAITKYGAEMEVWRASQEGIPVVIVNPGVILGPGFWNSGSGQLFKNIFNGFKFYTEGVTGYVAVNDVVKAMLQLMNSTIKNERFILVAENKSFKNVFDVIAENFDKKPPTIKVSKFMSAIGWRFEKVKYWFTRKRPLLSKQSAESMHAQRFYSSEKLEKALNFKFEPIAKTIALVCTAYKNKK
ncbi:SDR family oxidoreductase [Lutibacter holmesii]|uniref:SDR family oxidoreductase n=1 Tax=Lutibacter holmesii TaxID=1137985 RepID=A0ABW3WKL0_9FLAO